MSEDIVIHRCPQCGKIIGDSLLYSSQGGAYCENGEVRMERLVVVPMNGEFVGRMLNRVDVLARALRWYANPKHWREDDWNVPCVVASPEYGAPGKKARHALKRAGL